MCLGSFGDFFEFVSAGYTFVLLVNLDKNNALLTSNAVKNHSFENLAFGGFSGVEIWQSGRVTYSSTGRIICIVISSCYHEILSVPCRHGHICYFLPIVDRMVCERGGITGKLLRHCRALVRLSLLWYTTKRKRCITCACN